MDLWDMVEKIKEKDNWYTENDNIDIQSMMVSFEINQVLNESLQFSIDFSRKNIIHK